MLSRNAPPSIKTPLLMDPILTLFLSLLVAHLLADFLLQSNEDIARKAEPRFFFKHIATVTLLSWLLAGNWTNWIIPLAIASTHALLDWGKLQGQRRGWDDNRMFVWDQVGHIVVIFALTVLLVSRDNTSNAVQATLGEIYSTILLVAAGLIVAVFVGGLVIGKASAQFLNQINSDRAADPAHSEADAAKLRDGLRHGGQVIGQLERALIFFFVMIGRPEAVAFLVAAKSIFRFGELTKHSRNEAEYILIGTLMSFGWGLLIAWLTRYLLDRL